MPRKPSNKLKVLSRIGRHQPICRGELGRLTGLPSPTITNIVSECIEDGLVREIGFQVSTGGRKPALLELCPERQFLLGVELNAQQLTVLLLDLKANVHRKHIEQVQGNITQEQLEERMMAGIERCLDLEPEKRARVAGIGVGISGLVDSKQGVSIRFPGVNPWSPLPVVASLQQRFSLPTFLENNVAVRSLAELWFGRGRHRDNFLFVSIGPHVRMGIVIEGRLYRGINGNAGELGHITHREDGPLCYCGNFGCLETYASTTALVREARKVLQERTTVSGSLLAEIAPEELTAEAIFEAARAGDRLANSIVDKILEPLASVLSSLVNLFDTEAVILGGPLAAQGELVLNRVQQTIHKRSLPHLAQSVALDLSALGAEGGALGGGALIMQQLFEGVIPIQ